MKIVIPLLTVFALMLSFQSLSSETNDTSGNANKNSHPSFYSKPDLFNLNVTCLSNHSQLPGGQLMYNIRLTSLTAPIANALVKINDPIDKVCTFITTGSDGNAVWLKQIPKDANPQIYVFEFFYETAKQYSKVAVTTESVKLKLPSFKLDLDISKTLDPTSVVLGNRGGFSPLLQTIDKTLDVVTDFGDAVISDFLSNPVNDDVVVITGISCPLGGLGNPICIAGLYYTGSELKKSAVKILGYKIIDAIEKDAFMNERLKSVFDDARTGISIAKFKSGEGLKSTLDLLMIGQDLVELGKKKYRQFGNKINGAAFSVKFKGSNDVYMFSFYDRGYRNQQNITSSKDPNCNENQNGDYCFQNNTKSELRVNITSSPEIKSHLSQQFSCTLYPGQNQCFYNVPAGAAQYTISSFSGSNYYYGNGMIYIDTCKTNTFFINEDLPSYSTNQTSEIDINSKNSNCKESNTGDYCFKNNTKSELRINITSSPEIKSHLSQQFSLTLKPGQSQCFYNVPVGPLHYTVSSYSGFENYYANGQLYMDKCKTVFFNIK